jgi:hypothetical protein
MLNVVDGGTTFTLCQCDWRIFIAAVTRRPIHFDQGVRSDSTALQPGPESTQPRPMCPVKPQPLQSGRNRPRRTAPGRNSRCDVGAATTPRPPGCPSRRRIPATGRRSVVAPSLVDPDAIDRMSSSERMQSPRLFRKNPNEFHAGGQAAQCPSRLKERSKIRTVLLIRPAIEGPFRGIRRHDASGCDVCFISKSGRFRQRNGRQPDAVKYKKRRARTTPLNQNVSSARHYEGPELVLRAGITV